MNDESLFEKAIEIDKTVKKLSPALLMKSMKITQSVAFKICMKIWLRNNLEARREANNIYGRN